MSFRAKTRRELAIDREERLKNDTYAPKKAEAQKRADETGFDHGIEWLGTFGGWHVFMLPRRDNRYGHETRCEVVPCMNPATCQEGHGSR